ncbi:UNKNOWN [Stylonychia lemnae]|uniref:Uncharacterized protein n=1 Tax=Stylonychia lemnae TaxID=5949 RepID=A0A078AJH5_STYLE|nr:UNKNOWN [Stylonychia lemnae]|eukprot:CDW80933.1 UNKNOWN [Stylonychia lemnae]
MNNFNPSRLGHQYAVTIFQTDLRKQVFEDKNRAISTDSVKIYAFDMFKDNEEMSQEFSAILQHQQIKDESDYIMAQDKRANQIYY